MLILSRKPGEVINIGDQITIALIGVQGLQAKIGIHAPASIEVHRSEIYDRIQAERAATGPAHIDDRVKEADAEIDPRKAFATLNPAGFRSEDLEFGGIGFADEYAQRSYAVFLSGYRAALEACQCAS